MNRYSIICKLEKCYICERTPIHKHEVFYGTANRQQSIKYGLVVPLCYEHHMGQKGVHGIQGKELNIKLKQMAQQKAMEHYGWSVEDFIRIYGKNWL